MATLPFSAYQYQESLIEQDRGRAVVGVSILMIIVPTVAVAVRFYARVKRKLPWLADDLLVLPALALCIGLCVESIICVHYGVGKPVTATNQATVYKIIEVGFYLSITYSFTHWFIKISILLFYRRVFGLQTRWLKIAIYTMMVYATIWTLACFLLVMVQCRPTDYFWLQFSPVATQIHGVCTVDTADFEIPTSLLNIFADFAILIIPTFVLPRFQIALERKLALICVFAMGAFACTAGVVRLLAYITSVADDTGVTWTTSSLTWTTVEASVGLTCACFPVIAPIFSPFSIRGFFSSQRRAPKGSASSYGSFSQGSSYWQRISEKVRSGGKNPQHSRDRKQVDDQLPLHNIESLPSNSQRCLSPHGMLNTPDIALHVDPDWARREYLRPDIRDPRVINEFYRGVSPDDMGMDYDGKPLPIGGIRVRKDVEWAAEL